VKRRAPLEYSDTVWPLPKSLYLYVVRLDNKADWSAGMELAGADQCRPNAVSSSCGLRAMVVWDSVFVTALMAVSPFYYSDGRKIFWTNRKRVHKMFFGRWLLEVTGGRVSLQNAAKRVSDKPFSRNHLPNPRDPVSQTPQSPGGRAIEEQG